MKTIKIALFLSVLINLALGVSFLKLRSDKWPIELHNAFLSHEVKVFDNILKQLTSEGPDVEKTILYVESTRRGAQSIIDANKKRSNQRLHSITGSAGSE